jgi:hypothetical protein
MPLGAQRQSRQELLEFEIEVFSDPLSASSCAPVSKTAFEMRCHYEDLIKPAILLADRVILKSYRIDVEIGEKLEFEMTARPAMVLKRPPRPTCRRGHQRLDPNPLLIRPHSVTPHAKMMPIDPRNKWNTRRA